MRKLASIQKINNLTKIENSDFLYSADVLGWSCIVKKGEFSVGDMAVYIEIDSVVPDIPYFQFMQTRKFRVRTIKLRGALSQGLCVPLKDINVIYEQLNDGKPQTKNIGVEGQDVTQLLGITKYESPSDRESNSTGTPKKKHGWFVKFMTRFEWYRKLTHTKSKSFPEWISKTDETRLQNIPSVLNYKREFYISEKVDGCSMTVWYKHGLFNEFGICSRTVRKFEHDGSHWSKAAKQLNLRENLKKLGGDYAIQGELIHDKIQGGKYKTGKVNKPYDFFVFNVYDIKKKQYLPLDEMTWFCERIGLKTVPILYPHAELLSTVEEMLKFAEGKSVLADTEREGLVWRTHDQSLSFKTVSNIFLLKESN